MANEEQTTEEKESSAGKDTSFGTWVRRLRAQVLRRAATLAEDPEQGEAEQHLLSAAQSLQAAGTTTKLEK